MMRVAVTGGSGLVGRRIVEALATDHEVVNADLRRPVGEAAAVSFVSTDVRDAQALTSALDGCKAVVHAAALPGPSFGSEEEVLETNVEGTRNVASAARRLGIRRVVFISSESVLGFVFSGGEVRPRYLPVDESHPLAPTEPYGRSKLMAETLLARFAREGPGSGPGVVRADAPSGGAGGIPLEDRTEALTVISLRPPWVWVPEEYERLRELTKSPDEWRDGLWAYVHGDDLARAASLSLTVDVGGGFYAVYVAAPDNGTVFETRELLSRYYRDVPLKRDLRGFDGLVSSAGLESLLGFSPTMSWREFLE